MKEIMHRNLNSIAGGCTQFEKISDSCLKALEYVKENAANYPNPTTKGAAWLLEGCCKGDLLYAKEHLVTENNEYVLFALATYDTK